MIPRKLEPEIMDTLEASLAYETMDHTAPNTAVVQRLYELGACGLMLDLGTGPGHIPLGVCQQFAHASIIGVDQSWQMLLLAKKRIKAAAMDHRIRLHLSDIKRLPYADATFDVVFSNTTLHHIHDPLQMLREAWRVLKKHGVLLIRDLYRPASYEQRDALVQRHAATNTSMQRQLLCESLEAALTPQELLEMARQVGIPSPQITIDSDRHMTLQWSQA